uniref:EF-hand domain-containing protein n=1 Tax=Guillardia theta TaxID=55529 RepID=A0A7S4K5C3_GUITH|mmetsp:Transcript_21241/g.70487  ORF Transcript_21241/g.70487 Transcript_21241/m.70487 type:complete len:485 (+) Transcript_21241:123-1577(+)
MNRSIGSDGSKNPISQKLIKDTEQLFKKEFAGLVRDDLESKISDTFRILDTDKSGFLEKEEIHDALARMGRKMTDEELDLWIHEFDADGNGVLDEDEYAHMVRFLVGERCSITCISCLRGCNTTQRKEFNSGFGGFGGFGRTQSCPSVEANHQVQDHSSSFLGRLKKSFDDSKLSTKKKAWANPRMRSGSLPGGIQLMPRQKSVFDPKKEMDDLFDSMKEKQLRLKIDWKWKENSFTRSMNNFSSLLRQMNELLVTHLKGLPHDQLSHKIKETFDRFDLDGNGTLDRDEISQAFETMGKPLSKIELDTFMDSLEGDNEVLDLMEFTHMLKGILQVKCDSDCIICRKKGDDRSDVELIRDELKSSKPLTKVSMKENQEQKTNHSKIAVPAPIPERGGGGLFLRTSSFPVTRAEIEESEELSISKVEPAKFSVAKNQETILPAQTKEKVQKDNIFSINKSPGPASRMSRMLSGGMFKSRPSEGKSS